jgi:hypothetical protein
MGLNIVAFELAVVTGVTRVATLGEVSTTPLVRHLFQESIKFCQ